MKDWTKDKLINEIGYSKSIQGLTVMAQAFNELDIDITKWKPGYRQRTYIVPNGLIEKMNELCKGKLGKSWDGYKTKKWDCLVSESEEREYVYKRKIELKREEEIEKKKKLEEEARKEKEIEYYNSIPNNQKISEQWVKENIGRYYNWKSIYEYYWYLLQHNWKKANWKGDIKVQEDVYNKIMTLPDGKKFLQAKFKYKGYSHNIIGTYRDDIVKERNSGIYGIYINNQLVYIGITMRNFEDRWDEHRKGFEIKSNDNYYLYSSLKPGDVIRFERLLVIEELKVNDEITRRDLEAMELALIHIYQPKFNYQGIGDNQYKFTSQ